MTPRRIFWSILALAALSSLAGAAQDKMSFSFACTVPQDNQPVCPKTGPRCELKDRSGAPVTLELPNQIYEGASRPDSACAGLKASDFPAGSSCYAVTDLPNYICDFLRASGPESGFDAVFNALPTFAAQKAAIFSEITSANTAYATWFDFRVKADPSKLPADLTDQQKMKKLSSMYDKAASGLFAAAQPFLWPTEKSSSYLYGDNRSDPWTYTDYIGDRPSPSQSQSFNAITAEMDAVKLKQVAAARQAVSRMLPSGMSFSDLNRTFDGAGANAGSASSPALSPGVSAPSASGPVKPGKSPYSVGELPVPPVPMAVDGDAVPTPAGWSLLPKKLDTVSALGIFNRGYGDGVQRLKETASMMAAHAEGKTYTLGDPLDRATNGLHQLAGSCGIGAQYEALEARGKSAQMPELTKTAEDRGWYVEINERNAPNGQIGGTIFADEGKLLALHGVPNQVVQGADADTLRKWLVTSPSHDAIVDVRAKILWNNPQMADAVDHDIYVSGVEVDHASGKVMGYYINDTGTGEAGRYVPAATFEKAWGGDLVEIGAATPPPSSVTTVGGVR